MKTLPSKELLIEVLRDFFNHDNIEWIDKIEYVDTDIDIFYLYEYFDNYGTDGMCDSSSKNGKCTINIYELAHKCKEWAISKGYHIESMLYDENVDRKYTSGLAKVLFSDANSNYNEVFYCDESTEPEAIFKACEWIMERTK